MNNEQSLSINGEIQKLPPPYGGGGGVALFVAAIVIAFAAGSWVTKQTITVPESQPFATSSTSFEKPVVVQIGGQVKNPGVYEMPFNSRVYQAISKAGGLLPDAETENINLADWVKDGSQIVVPAKRDASIVPAEPAETDLAPDTYSLSLDPEKQDTSPAERTFTKKTKPVAPKSTQTKPHKSTSKELPKTTIDLNRASSEQLQQLPGVGPAMADRILQYRKENQGFTSVDDLDNVRGIGAKTLEKIRPYVIVKPLSFQKSVN